MKPGSAAIDRGVAIANVTDGFAGRAPDLGALESGVPLPVYGPRPAPPVSPTSREVAADTYFIPGAVPADRGPDGNTVVLVAPAGLIAIDTGRHPLFIATMEAAG